MIAVETIHVHKACNSQIVVLGHRQLFCEVCNHPVRPDDIKEVDNSPSPFAG